MEGEATIREAKSHDIRQITQMELTIAASDRLSTRKEKIIRDGEASKLCEAILAQNPFQNRIPPDLP